MNKKDLMDQVVEWLENEVYEGAEVVEAIDNNEQEITSNATDNITYGRHECAESLLNQIKKWQGE